MDEYTKCHGCGFTLPLSITRDLKWPKRITSKYKCHDCGRIVKRRKAKTKAQRAANVKKLEEHMATFRVE